MSKSPTQVFISYRRVGGAELARNVYDALEKRGYIPFMDVEGLRAGPFNEELYKEIETATDVVVILTSGSLKRCGNVDDWVRLEIAHAFNSEKNIVPVMAGDFKWDNKNELPLDGSPYREKDIDIDQFKKENINQYILINEVLVKNGIDPNNDTSMTAERLTAALNELIKSSNLPRLLADNKGLSELRTGTADTETMLNNQKKMAEIYPLTLRLPKDIARLPSLNGVGHSQELFRGSMDKLESMLVAKPKKYIVRKIMYAAVAVAVLSAGLTVLWHQRQSYSTTVIEEARKLSAQKDYAGAFYAYSKASDNDLKNISLHQNVEESARRGRLGAQLLQRYRALAEKYPNEPIYNNYLGNAYLMLDPDDKDGKARAGYEKAVKLDPQFAPAINNLAIIAYRKGDIAAAENMFVRYLKLEPNDAVGWADLGLLYLYKAEANPKDASVAALSRQAFDKATALDAGLALAYKGSGRLLALQGQKDKALDAFKRSLALDYDQPEVRRQVELLVWDTTREGAVQAADDMHTRGLHEQMVLNKSLIEAMRALDKGNYKEAETLSRGMQEQYPDNPLVLRLLGRSLEAAGKNDEAKKVFDAAGLKAGEQQ